MPKNDLSSSDQPVEKTEHQQTEQEILEFWTREKQKDARALPLPTREPPPPVQGPDPPDQNDAPVMEDEED